LWLHRYWHPIFRPSGDTHPPFTPLQETNVSLFTKVSRLISAAGRSTAGRSPQNLANPKPRQWETCAIAPLS
jgi:hypothetical protein